MAGSSSTRDPFLSILWTPCLHPPPRNTVFDAQDQENIEASSSKQKRRGPAACTQSLTERTKNTRPHENTTRTKKKGKVLTACCTVYHQIRRWCYLFYASSPTRWQRTYLGSRHPHPRHGVFGGNATSDKLSSLTVVVRAQAGKGPTALEATKNKLKQTPYCTYIQTFLTFWSGSCMR